VTLTTELPGRTSAYRVAEVRPQVGGILQQRLFEEGAEVKAGQSLYQIDPASYRAIEAGARAQLAAAEAQSMTARLAAERAEGLISGKLISQQDYDNAQALRRRAEAEVGVARAALQTAAINLGYTRITAPIGGRIGRSLVTEGALLKAVQDNAIATVQQLDPIYVDVTQSSADLQRLQRELASGRLQQDKSAARVTLTLEDGTPYARDGRLQFTEVAVDRDTGTVLLRAVFPNPKRELLPGQFVRAQIGQAVSSAALLVPQPAVSRNARGEATVLVVGDGDVVSERVIHTRRVVEGQWLVDDGLKAGERIVVEGQQKARPGLAVRAVVVGKAGG
jgi:membrane fusion protein (multidrug efflux system)